MTANLSVGKFRTLHYTLVNPTAQGFGVSADLIEVRLALVLICLGSTQGQAAPAADNYLDFLVYGDTRDAETSHHALVQRMSAETASLVLHTGDIVGAGGDIAAWERFVVAEAPLLARPFYAVAGNHEYVDDPQLVQLRRFMKPPAPSVVHSEETELLVGSDGGPLYYSFRRANALFIALDSNRSRDPQQAAWLSGTLRDAERDRVRHVFVFFHHPPFAVGDNCGRAVDDGLWLAEFVHHRVRAVFVGHSHSYQHLERRGVRYFVTGGGGAPLDQDLSDCAEWDREALIAYRAEHHYLRVRVRGDDVRIEALDVHGNRIELVDARGPALDTGAVARIPFLDPAPHRDSRIIGQYKLHTGHQRPGNRDAPLLAVAGLLTLWLAIRYRRRQQLVAREQAIVRVRDGLNEGAYPH